MLHSCLRRGQQGTVVAKKARFVLHLTYIIALGYCYRRQKTTRMEAAHCVAKILVTTNPNLLSEHQRLGSVKPLVMLCKESGATDLQHFETLLALTNVLSCGEAEHEKLAAEKGVTAVHYLIFSENWMVRRAAVEALCNMAASEHLLKVTMIGFSVTATV